MRRYWSQSLGTLGGVSNTYELRQPREAVSRGRRKQKDPSEDLSPRGQLGGEELGRRPGKAPVRSMNLTAQTSSQSSDFAVTAASEGTEHVQAPGAGAASADFSSPFLSLIEMLKTHTQFQLSCVFPGQQYPRRPEI